MLKGDVRLIKNINDLTAFQRFLKMCASRCGQLVNLTSLANDCGITHNTAKAWLSILETSFIIFLLAPYHENIGKRLIKSQKIYFYDCGLLCSLLNIENFEQIKTHYLRGGIFETFIISELLKYRSNKGLRSNLYFWRDKTGHEVDCLIEENNSIIPIEIKSSLTISNNFFSGIKYLKENTKKDIKKSFLIYAGNVEQSRNDIKILPWNKLINIS